MSSSLFMTPYDYAILAQDSYDLKNTNTAFLNSIGWARDAAAPKPDAAWASRDKFTAHLYTNQGKKAAVLAFRGSVELVNWVSSDAPFAAGRPPRHTDMVVQWAKSVLDWVRMNETLQQFSISTTGHGLGGMWAAFVARYFDLASVSFDSPGVEKAMVKYGMEGKEFVHTNFVVAPNLINVMGEKYGRWVCLQEDPHNFVGQLAAMASATLEGLSPGEGYVKKAEYATIGVENMTDTMPVILERLDPVTGGPYEFYEPESWPSKAEYLARKHPEVGKPVHVSPVTTTPARSSVEVVKKLMSRVLHPKEEKKGAPQVETKEATS